MATLLESVNIAEAVTDVAAILTDDCYIQTSTVTIGAAGGRAATWADSAVVKCRKSQVSNKEGLAISERFANTIGWSFLVPYATTVTSKSRVKDSAGVYEVVSVNYCPSFPAWKRVYCVEVT